MAENTDRLTHIDEQGAARMVDVAGKPVTHRRAVAEGIVRMLPATLALIESGEAAKGDVIAAARIAGIMAAKRTSELVPLCHPLSLTHVSVEIAAVPPATGADATDAAAGPSGAPTAAVRIRATAETDGKTGVEMEALTAASVAALTIYDMCKAVDRGMVIDGVKLLHKEGGASGTWTREED